MSAATFKDSIALILVHYNTEKETKNCLRSLLKIDRSGFKFSIIVVDNGSQEPLQLPQTLQPKHVEIIRSQANLGFTGGNNLGMWHAREQHNPDYLVLLNTDTTVAPNFLVKLYACMKSLEKPGLICPKIYFSKGFEYHSQSYSRAEKGSILWYAGGTVDWKQLTAFHRGVDEIDRGHFDKQQISDFSTGCCVMIPREVLETIGLLDKRYFLYYEDVDFSLHAAKFGYASYFCPQAKVWHDNAGSSGGAGADISLYYQTRNRLLFTMKWAPLRQKITAIAWALRTFSQGSAIERKAVQDFFLGRMGKQPVH